MEDLRDRPAHEGGPVVDRRQPQAVSGELGGESRRTASSGSTGRLLQFRRLGLVPVDRRQGEVAGPIVRITDHVGQAAVEGAAGVRLHVAEGDRTE